MGRLATRGVRRHQNSTQWLILGSPRCEGLMHRCKRDFSAQDGPPQLFYNAQTQALRGPRGPVCSHRVFLHQPRVADKTMRLLEPKLLLPAPELICLQGPILHILDPHGPCLQKFHFLNPEERVQNLDLQQAIQLYKGVAPILRKGDYLS